MNEQDKINVNCLLSYRAIKVSSLNEGQLAISLCSLKTIIRIGDNILNDKKVHSLNYYRGISCVPLSRNLVLSKWGNPKPISEIELDQLAVDIDGNPIADLGYGAVYLADFKQVPVDTSIFPVDSIKEHPLTIRLNDLPVGSYAIDPNNGILFQNTSHYFTRNGDVYLNGRSNNVIPIPAEYVNFKTRYIPVNELPNYEYGVLKGSGQLVRNTDNILCFVRSGNPVSSNYKHVRALSEEELKEILVKNYNGK